MFFVSIIVIISILLFTASFFIFIDEKINFHADRFKTLAIIYRTTIHAAIGIILFSMLALVINCFINYYAVLFQWNFVKEIDSGHLKNYKSFRNNFIYLGAIIGIVISLIEERKNYKRLLNSNQDSTES